jgi:hypothetical protein
MQTPAQQTPTPTFSSEPSALEKSIMEQLTRTANERDTFNASVRDRVMKMLEPKDTPSLDDPDIAPQHAAFRSAARRANDRGRAQMAERMAQQGQLDSGAFDSVVERGLANTQALEAQNAADLVGNRMQQRMAELQTVMQLGAGIMSGDQQAELQKQMALLDSEMRRSQFAGDLGLRTTLGTGDLNLRNRLGTEDINMRKKLGAGQMDLGLLELLLRNQNFNDQLGFNIGAFGQNAARQSILDLL